MLLVLTILAFTCILTNRAVEESNSATTVEDCNKVWGSQDLYNITECRSMVACFEQKCTQKQAMEAAKRENV
ncbi:hypothetical protein ACQ4LE_002830 [Meloidogyne hapla]|uniref:Secreted protein n=1 Tax=Meloidogyne hapla TaxID=6305 RepID=A0A1I8BXF8_MELHA